MQEREVGLGREPAGKQASDGVWVGSEGRYRVKRGCYFLPLGLELHLPH